MQTVTQDHLENFSTFLIDASGVLYTDQGPIPGIQDRIKHLKELGTVIVVTNNSNNTPEQIAEKFMQSNIPIDKNQIISSGHGLKYDSKINALIQNKSIYLYGKPQSAPYIETAGGQITQNLENADAIVMTSTFKEDQDRHHANIATFCKQTPHIPVICCNTDQYVMGIKGLIPVIGSYAKKLEIQIGRPLHWIGKPLSNFSNVVKHILTKEKNITLNKDCLFFDDNPDNVTSLIQDLDISGCLVKETGLSKNIALDALSHRYPSIPFSINSLGA